MKTCVQVFVITIVAGFASALTLILDNIQFQKELKPFAALESQKNVLEKRLERAEWMCARFKSECERQMRIASLVQVPGKTELIQKAGVKQAIVTVPPDLNQFDMYENYIELEPRPHFAKKPINMDRWNQIWKCTCPITCDCWIGKSCSYSGCSAEH